MNKNKYFIVMGLILLATVMPEKGVAEVVDLSSPHREFSVASDGAVVGVQARFTGEIAPQKNQAAEKIPRKDMYLKTPEQQCQGDLLDLETKLAKLDAVIISKNIACSSSHWNDKGGYYSIATYNMSFILIPRAGN